MSLCAAVLFTTAGFAAGETNAADTPKTWEELTREFESSASDGMTNSQKMGPLLRQADQDRTVSYLVGFLGKNNPQGVRLKALYALGAAALPKSRQG